MFVTQVPKADANYYCSPKLQVPMLTAGKRMGNITLTVFVSSNAEKSWECDFDLFPRSFGELKKLLKWKILERQSSHVEHHNAGIEYSQRCWLDNQWEA